MKIKFVCYIIVLITLIPISYFYVYGVTPNTLLGSPFLQGVNFASVYKTGNYSPNQYDTVINVNATQGGFKTYTNPAIVTLPDAASFRNLTLTVKKVDYGLGPVMIKASGSDKIDVNFSNFNLTGSGDFITLQSNKTGWQILSYVPKSILNDRVKGTSENLRVTSAILAFTPTTGTAVPTTGIFLSPIQFANNVRIDTIGIIVQTGIAASSCDLAIYRDNGTSYPSMQVTGSFKNVATTTSTSIASGTYSPPLNLQFGKYWLAIECGGGAGVTANAFGLANLPSLGVTTSTGAGVASSWGWVLTNTFSASSFPNPFPSV